jgi:threonine synthase
VTEAEIEAALFALARSGLYVEPTCATTAAAFANLLLDGTIGPEETTVLVLTGTGLKATQRIAALMGMEV